MRGVLCQSLVAVVASGCWLTGARGDVVDRLPPLSMVLEIEGIPIDIDSWSCGEVLPLADGTFLFTGEHSVEGLGDTRWSVRYDPDPFVVADLVAINTTSVAQTYGITVVLPTTFAGPTVMGGSIVGSICDARGDGGFLEAPLGGAVAVSIIDGDPVPGGALLSAPAMFIAAPYGCATIGPAEFGAPIPAAAGGPVQLSIGISISFVVSAGDAMNCVGVFVVEAAPPSPEHAEPGDLVADRGSKEVQP